MCVLVRASSPLVRVFDARGVEGGRAAARNKHSAHFQTGLRLGADAAVFLVMCFRRVLERRRLARFVPSAGQTWVKSEQHADSAPPSSLGAYARKLYSIVSDLSLLACCADSPPFRELVLCCRMAGSHAASTSMAYYRPASMQAADTFDSAWDFFQNLVCQASMKIICIAIFVVVAFQDQHNLLNIGYMGFVVLYLVFPYGLLKHGNRVLVWLRLYNLLVLTLLIVYQVRLRSCACACVGLWCLCMCWMLLDRCGLLRVSRQAPLPSRSVTWPGTLGFPCPSCPTLPPPSHASPFPTVSPGRP
jgi:hypothetical protein